MTLGEKKRKETNQREFRKMYNILYNVKISDKDLRILTGL